MARKKKLLLAEEIDIASIPASETLIPATAAQYDGAIKKFCEVHGLIHIPFMDLPRRILTDRNISIFLRSLGESTDYSWPTKKTAMAAINKQLKFAGKENIFDSPPPPKDGTRSSY